MIAVSTEILDDKSLLTEREGWDELKIAAEDFVRKVECGEAYSKRSYAKFKKALLMLAAPKQEGQDE